MKKRLLSIMTAITILTASMNTVGSTNAATVSATTVKDIAGHWAESSITSMISKGYVSGYPDGTFKPNATITRAEFLKMVVNAMELKVDTSTTGKWYVPYVNAAVAAGIHNTKDFNANYDRPITRQEIAQIAVRATTKELRTGKETSTQLMYEATKQGLISGLSNGELGIDQNSTRAQAVVITQRVLTVENGGTLQADKRAASYAEVAWHHTNIETMWGGKMKALPLSMQFSWTVNGTFEEILIIDLSDKNSPYRSWVPDLIKVNTKDWSNDYLIAMKVTMQNTKTAAKGTTAYFYDLLGNTAFKRAIIQDKTSPISTRTPLQLDKLDKVTTWHLLTISKEDLEHKKTVNSTFWYFDTNMGYSIKLSEDGTLFSN
ncbi:S-layer family protein [Paenibacillus cellulosilyticus]|uniref:S-layer family protein n=1 Tax=Paenibacillus cellulosilyticus TaxID=375489 RepID=A0A2V2YMG3_9BACL|nr:S-layer homology domain-containing protein [Paenibacillus cellulosilyticus]PWV95604.1 S-layer family protein [Paenibacillus cellulosilyticus]QKS47328.1 S-layer homology domain-containing protein [Paenibacillus cellulosilyticus]